MSALHFVFDGPPGHQSGRFVEVETPDGNSINAGEWHERADGLWELRVQMPDTNAIADALRPFAKYWQWMLALNDPEWIKLAHRDEYFSEPLTVAHFRRAASVLTSETPDTTRSDGGAG